jgi:hypothetical protein
MGEHLVRCKCGGIVASGREMREHRIVCPAIRGNLARLAREAIKRVANQESPESVRKELIGLSTYLQSLYDGMRED